MSAVGIYKLTICFYPYNITYKPASLIAIKGYDSYQITDKTRILNDYIYTLAKLIFTSFDDEEKWIQNMMRQQNVINVERIILYTEDKNTEEVREEEVEKPSETEESDDENKEQCVCDLFDKINNLVEQNEEFEEDIVSSKNAIRRLNNQNDVIMGKLDWLGKRIKNLEKNK